MQDKTVLTPQAPCLCPSHHELSANTKKTEGLWEQIICNWELILIALLLKLPPLVGPFALPL